MSAPANSLSPPGLGSSEETPGSTPASTWGSPAQSLPQIWAALPRTCPRSGQPANKQIVQKSAYPKVLGSLPGVLPGFAARVLGPFATSKESSLLAGCPQYKL